MNRNIQVTHNEKKRKLKLRYKVLAIIIIAILVISFIIYMLQTSVNDIIKWWNNIYKVNIFL